MTGVSPASRVRVLVVLARPAVMILLGLFTATGLAQAGAGGSGILLARALVPVAAFLLFAVLVNDMADEAVDRVNLAHDVSRPLVTGASHRREMVVTAAVAATLSLASSLLLPWPAVLVVLGGLALAAAYSLPPVQLSKRGAVASLALPAGYVAVPYLLGVLSGRPAITAADLLLMAGLYVGFIGRIVLKDFRDVRGDALFGKRTFLVRHGRRATCALSAASWLVGMVTLVAVRGADAVLGLVYGAFVVVALILLRRLADDGGTRRDERLVSAIAILGRGLIVTVIGHLTMVDAGWAVGLRAAALGVFTASAIGIAASVAKHGHTTRLTVPPTWDVTSPGCDGRCTVSEPSMSPTGSGWPSSTSRSPAAIASSTTSCALRTRLPVS